MPRQYYVKFKSEEDGVTKPKIPKHSKPKKNQQVHLPHKHTSTNKSFSLVERRHMRPLSRYSLDPKPIKSRKNKHSQVTVGKE